MHADFSPLYLPRRHRRRLLFPPGLLALAGLLWVGCVALGPWLNELQPKRVLQLTMPIVLSQGMPKNELDLGFYMPSPAEAQVYGPWLNASFTGNLESDTREQVRVAALISTMRIHTDSGVRILFFPGSHYEQLVFVLNELAGNNIRRYWVDFHKSPWSINAIKISDKPAPISKQEFFPFCGTVSYTPPTRSPSGLQLSNEANNPRQGTLLQSEWRPTMWLLAAIAALSTWRMVRRP
ncbi:hypothetical protein GCM10023185_21720 [Hymenobacter saemangeumensis]|uniref:Uncharacterized protein n=1 Tax=Hymenobacter saemangeumensis TaxID=1084522 RepID=A0ABP8IEF5_9BACT